MNGLLFYVLFITCFISSARKSTGLNESISEQRDVDGYLTLVERAGQSMRPDHNYIEYHQANYKANEDKMVLFAWNYNKHSDTISKLLSGEKVTLYSDVKQSDTRYDALRLTEVYFRFKTCDKGIQSAVDNVLFNFELESDHLGNSYFRSNGQYCLLSTGNYKIWYSLEIDEDKGPVSRCFSYDSIKMYMFSPYASWDLQLLPSLEKSLQFPILQQYKEKIQIELMGRGRKLDEKNLKQYCKPVNSADLPKV